MWLVGDPRLAAGAVGFRLNLDMLIVTSKSLHMVRPEGGQQHEVAQLLSSGCAVALLLQSWWLPARRRPARLAPPLHGRRGWA